MAKTKTAGAAGTPAPAVQHDRTAEGFLLRIQQDFTPPGGAFDTDFFRLEAVDQDGKRFVFPQGTVSGAMQPLIATLLRRIANNAMQPGWIFSGQDVPGKPFGHIVG